MSIGDCYKYRIKKIQRYYYPQFKDADAWEYFVNGFHVEAYTSLEEAKGFIYNFIDNLFNQQDIKVFTIGEYHGRYCNSECGGRMKYGISCNRFTCEHLKLKE
jgi:hypothetical protein